MEAAGGAEETVLNVLPLRMLSPSDGRPFDPPPTAQWIPRDGHVPICGGSERKSFRRAGGKPRRSRPAAQVPSNPDSPRKVVQATLRLYDALRRNLLQEEEIKGKVAGRARPDLYAGSIIISKGLSPYRSEKVLGVFPGVEVGDHFCFRMEMNCLGFHGPIQGGIDYLTARENPWNVPVAISIISSSGYHDRDDAETLIYTGQGGKSDVKGGEDQKLERGNLAMEGSMKLQVPVRVVRGIKVASSSMCKVYTYDGLYRVERCWSEKGRAGFEEYKFQLQRLPGQPELGSRIIELTNGLRQRPSMRGGVRVADISGGAESTPVCVVNVVDSDPAPPIFTYSTKVQYPCGLSELRVGAGCSCRDACQPSAECRCFSQNGNEFAYLSSGVLVKEKDIVYECGSGCTCPPTCRNRLAQRGPKLRLEVFKAGAARWGLRSWDPIPAGSFVCEYTGRAAVAGGEAEQQAYVLRLRRGAGREIRWGDSSVALGMQPSGAGRHHAARPHDLLLYATHAGSAARFVAHSCMPNLLVQPVLHDHRDPRFPHAMLFAADNIPPLRELTLDYSAPGRTHEGGGTGGCVCGSLACMERLRR